MIMKILSKISYWFIGSLLIVAIACSEDNPVLPDMPVPTISSMPTSGSPGDELVMEGIDLVDVESVTFDGINALIGAASSDSEIHVTIPFDEANTVYGVIKVASIFEDTTIVADFTLLLPAPSVTSVFPESVVKNEKVIVTGEGFIGVTAVTVGGVAIDEYTVNETGTQVTFTTPDVATGAVAITNEGGSGESPISLEIDQTKSLFLLSDFDGNGLFPTTIGINEDGAKYEIWSAKGGIHNDVDSETGFKMIEGSENGLDGNYMTATGSGVSWDGGPMVAAVAADYWAITQTDPAKVWVEGWYSITSAAPAENNRAFFHQVVVDSWGGGFYAKTYALNTEEEPYIDGEWVKISINLADYTYQWAGDQVANPIDVLKLTQINVGVSDWQGGETTVRLDNFSLIIED